MTVSLFITILGSAEAAQLAAIGEDTSPALGDLVDPVAPVGGCAPGEPCTWERTYGGQLEDKAYGVAGLADGGLVVIGHSRSFSGHYDGLFLGLDRAGQQRWQRVLGGPRNDHAYGVVATADGGFAIVGQTRSWGNGESDLWLVRLDAAGTVAWDRTIGGAGNDRGRAIAALPDGGMAVAGFVTASGTAGAETGRDAYFARLSPDGSILWQAPVTMPPFILPRPTRAGF